MAFERPRGDITTVLDLTDRDAQDHHFFPLDTEGTWFHRAENRVIHPTALSVQEFPQRGPADWGQKCTFELNAVHAGDLLQSVILQFQLGSWYNATVLKRLYAGEITTDTTDFSADYWTYANSLGTSIIEYADFVVGDQTLERITGEWIRTWYNVYADIGSVVGIAADAVGAVPAAALAKPAVLETAFHPRRPFPTENGVMFCVLPFFFTRTKLKEVFPILACNEGQIRVDVKLRPFDEVVRQFRGWRSSCSATPCGNETRFVLTADPNTTITTTNLPQPPEFRDFRLVTCAVLLGGSLRSNFLRLPFEQAVKKVQLFHFEEPFKYLVTKANSNTDAVDIQLPLELNHPVVELVWVFRRKAVAINNEWTNFSPMLAGEHQILPDAVSAPWLEHAALRVNGQEIISERGEWFREHIAQVHKGGAIAYRAHMYGYSFALRPDEHAPTGTANMSRASSVTLRLRVRTPFTPIDWTAAPYGYDADRVNGWTVDVFAVHYNWLRFENGMCQTLFSD